MTTVDAITAVAFWCSFSLLVYIYAGYPILVRILASTTPRRTFPVISPDLPLVSIVVCTRDNGSAVEDRVNNCLAQDYPNERFEILIGCDDRPDTFDSIASLRRARTTVVAFPRVGKATVQNALIARASGEIILTTDVQTRFQSNLLKTITAPFLDPAIGGVTGVMQIRNAEQSATAANETLYWSAESYLRQWESDAGLLLSVVGACFAFRRRAYRPIRPESDTDNIVPLQLAEAGLRTIQCPEAVVDEEAIPTPELELKNRTRTVTRSVADYLRHPCLLNPIKHPKWSLAIFSHKLLRWLTPHIGLVMIAAGLCRLSQWPELILTGVGLTCLCLGVAGMTLRKYTPVVPPVLTMAESAVLVSAACLRGTYRAARGHRQVTW